MLSVKGNAPLPIKKNGISLRLPGSGANNGKPSELDFNFLFN